MINWMSRTALKEYAHLQDLCVTPVDVKITSTQTSQLKYDGVNSHTMYVDTYSHSNDCIIRVLDPAMNK
jgi:hypothetical protein